MLLKALTPVAAVLLALGCAEGLARLLAIAAGQDRLIVYDERLGWRLRPGVEKLQRQDAEYLVSVNSHGLRDTEYDYQRRPGFRRILVLGDSFTFGFGGVEAEQRFTEIIEGRRSHLEVINSGVPSYEPHQEYLYLLDEGARYRPDLILLALYVNDYALCFRSIDEDIGRPKGYISLEDGALKLHPPQFPLPYVLSQRSYLFGLLDNRLGLRRAWRPAPAPEMSDAAREEAFRQLIAAIAQRSRAAGAKLAAVYFPPRSGRDSPIPALVAETARIEGFLFEDLSADVLRRHAASPLYFPQDGHFNAEGHAFVADLIDERIVGPLLFAASGDGR